MKNVINFLAFSSTILVVFVPTFLALIIRDYTGTTDGFSVLLSFFLLIPSIGLVTIPNFQTKKVRQTKTLILSGIIVFVLLWVIVIATK